MPRKTSRCQWVNLTDALVNFVTTKQSTQSSEHIKQLHWYVACRLVIEGGFAPDEITPRPPFIVRKDGSRLVLEHLADAGGWGERTVLGGLKTKVVDVVVVKNGLGPVIAVSMKGTVGAFRNLTNRMEEAVGDCTNLHISYPALVYGFFHVMKATHPGEGIASNDVAVLADDAVVDGIARYHDAIARLAGRSDVRDDPTQYEAVALALIGVGRNRDGPILSTFPPTDSPLLADRFFQTLYEQYDRRFVFAAPGLERTTRRFEWDPSSPVIGDARTEGYLPRLATT